MSKLQHGSQDELETIRLKAAAHFGPILLQGALIRLRRACGEESLDRFEKAMLDVMDRSPADDADFEDMKEFATEHLLACLREVRASADINSSAEDIGSRRTSGRSEKRETLETQLQEGLEDTFPASDPPAVVSTTISGGARKLVGTDEVLAQRRKQHQH